MSTMTQTRTSSEPSRDDSTVMDRQIEAVPLPDWDIVDEAALESFPASDPPPWWAGGVQK